MGFLGVSAIFVSILAAGTAMEVVYMDDWCDQTFFITGSPQYRVKLTSSSSYEPNMDCTFTVTGDYVFEDQLMIQFEDLSIEYESDCENDWLSIYDGDDKSSPSIGESKFCGQDTPSGIYTTTGDSITFYFKSDDSLEYSGFDIILTHYKTDYCDSWEISCDNGRCIDDSLRCNGYNPCGDYSDCQLSFGQIAGIAVGGFVFVFFVVIIVVVVVRRRRRGYVSASPVMPACVTTTTVGSVGYPGYPGYQSYQGYTQQPPMPPKYSDLPQQAPAYNAAAAPGYQQNQQNAALLTSYPPPPAYTSTQPSA